MVKQRILALLMAGVLLVGTAVPAYAASEDESGGTASSNSTPSEQLPEDDIGGLAETKTEEDPAEEKRPPKPAPADDIGGLADPNAAQKEDEDEDNDSDSEETPSESESLEGKILAGVTLDSTNHIAYVSGSGGQFPTFRPSEGVTRAAAAVMLFRLLPQNAVPSPSADYSDVSANAWYGPAARTMGTLGVVRPDETEFLPNEFLTRGEFIRYAASFFPLRTDADLLADVPETDENAPYIRSALAYGWVQGGSDGTFRPDDPLTRAAAVTILNRALGRTADKAYIAAHHPAFYLDVSPNTWYYYDILEASIAHQHSGSETWTSHTARTETPANGFHLLSGWLYYYDAAQGDIVRNRSIGNFPFNAMGRFTSGDAGLDEKLHQIVKTQTNDSMTQSEKLRALYVYTRDSFKYLRRPAYAMGAHDFMVTDALRILNTGYGNCYCYASLFWFLSRWIGFDSVIYSGTVGQNRAPHSWVEIQFDGKWYIYDTELEMAYHRKGRYDINLYHFIDRGNGWRYVRPKS